MARRSSRRRCASCGTALPRDANPRRRYCGPACAARAYRARKRHEQMYEQMVVDGRALVAGVEPEMGIICPGCGWRIYPGGTRLRADARHCSPTCRQRDYRARHGHQPMQYKRVYHHRRADP